jgi:RHS repeat-associated protein
VVTQASGEGQSAYGFTGEMQDAASGMVYLRSRYYNVADGRFQSRDTWGGDSNKPISFNHWDYGFSNPIQYKDPTGLAPDVDCNQINPVLSNMRELCKTANGDVDDSTQRYYVLTAREQIFREIAKISITQGSVFGEGYRWAGVLLSHFLDGGGYYSVNLASNSSFQSDRGILRATKLKLPQLSDDAQEITPLLHVFLNYIKENQVCNGLIPDMHLKGENYYVKGSPRALDTGWWGAFGHVNIDGDYVNSWISQEGYGFYISTKVTYTIYDHYEWGHKEGTPLPIGAFNTPPLWKLDGVRKFVGMVDIPHAWEVSLRKYGWAKEFDFNVTWSERMDIIVPPGFSSFYTQGLYDDLGN